MTVLLIHIPETYTLKYTFRIQRTSTATTPGTFGIRFYLNEIKKDELLSTENRNSFTTFKVSSIQVTPGDEIRVTTSDTSSGGATNQSIYLQLFKL